MRKPNLKKEPKTMSLVRKFSIPTEVRKAMKGKKTKVSLESIILAIGPHYLGMVNAAKGQASGQKAIAELERIFCLEDPRG